MTQFLDGPAQGVTLMLGRAPKLLRFVSGPNGPDALDQLDDEPKPEETVTVYVRMTDPVTIHVDMRDRRKSGWYQMADYRVAAKQPPDDVARDTKKWREWTEGINL